MQYGTFVSDPVCGGCKKKIEMAVLTEAVYQDGRWWHTACQWAGAEQRLRATPLSEAHRKQGTELLITSPLVPGGALPG